MTDKPIDNGAVTSDPAIAAQIERCLAAGMTPDRVVKVLSLMADAEINRRFGQPHHGHRES